MYCLDIVKFASPPLIGQTLAFFRNGAHDPTTSWDGRNFWRAIRTDDGPATLHLIVSRDAIDAEACGPGADAALRRVEFLVGEADTPPVLPAEHDAVARAHRKFGALRLGATKDPYHELLPAVLGQRVTAREAVTQWRQMCITMGEPAPAMAGAPSLRMPPEPAVLSKQPYWVFHRLGIERRRANALIEVARHEGFLRRLVREAPPDATRQLQQIQGVGPWTAAVAGLPAFGDSDALCVGDFHAKNTVAFALTGAHRGTDEEMCALLSPYAPHRARVLRWLQLDGWNAPAHGPRRRNLTIAQM